MYSKKQILLVKKVLQTNKTNYWTGENCKKFEKEFSTFHKINYSISVSNGSVALEMVMRALNLKKNDEVLVTPRSFIISASCVVNLGLKPVFADVDDNGNLNIENIRKYYNKKIKAIIIVHLNGLACDLDPIIKFVKKNKLFLIEDCSQAHGAIYKGNRVGSFGYASIWSFCQDKIISTGGEGGMISTNNKNLWLKLWSLKDHGKNYHKAFYKKKKLGFNWLHDFFGTNHRMTEMQAVIGREQLKLLDRNIKKRNTIVNLYLKALKNFFKKGGLFKKLNFKCQDCPIKKKVIICNNCTHSFYRLNIFLKHKKIKPYDLIKALNNKNIDSGNGPCPEIYKEKIFKKLKFYPKKSLSNAKLLGETSFSLPIDPHKSLKKIKENISKIKIVFNDVLNSKV
jgi:dTDP-4-amino-4,6-dideoxygalactose transaminase